MYCLSRRNELMNNQANNLHTISHVACTRIVPTFIKTFHRDTLLKDYGMRACATNRYFSKRITGRTLRNCRNEMNVGDIYSPDFEQNHLIIQLGRSMNFKDAPILLMNNPCSSELVFKKVTHFCKTNSAYHKTSMTRDEVFKY